MRSTPCLILPLALRDPRTFVASIASTPAAIPSRAIPGNDEWRDRVASIGGPGSGGLIQKNFRQEIWPRDAGRGCLGVRRRGLARLAGSVLMVAFAGAAVMPAVAASGVAPIQVDELEDLEELLAAERAEADLGLRRGQWSQARKLLRVHLQDDENDGLSRTLLAEGYLGQDDLDRAIQEASRAVGDLASENAEGAARAGRVWLRSLEELGRSQGALDLLKNGAQLYGIVSPEIDAQSAWGIGRLYLSLGQIDLAEPVLKLGAQAEEETWRGLLARSRCERALGELVQSSRTLVRAMDLADELEGPEPDLLVALGEVYFESEQEVEARGKRSAGSLFKKALQMHPGHADALLGLHSLHRLNRLRQSRSPESILAELLKAHPNCLRAKVRRAGDDLSDGHLPRVRKALTDLEGQAPKRRDVQILRAALSYVEHERDSCDQILARLRKDAPLDSTPEREVGRYLVELYRFLESIPYLQAAVYRDEDDHQAWTRLGGALANVGREDEARLAFDKAVEKAGGRQDAWRDNLRNVLGRMAKSHVREGYGPLEFSWKPDAAEVFRTYWVPFYLEAREELAQRYSFTPERTTIEVFREHGDFSVRSVGFEGFPALGVCFGPVVTSLSPLSAMRGQFSWARTGFHEFSHVIHLGLSHNRCPRWITEGLATWEEVNRNPSWTRNMRLDLLNARANNNLILVRDLNRAFRGPRILFGYYQGGLLCQMLIEQHGFSPMVRLLEAFDKGQDLDQAIGSVFQTTPEAMDVEFEAYVDGLLQGLVCEPSHNPNRTRRMALGLSEDPPENPDERLNWAHDWLTVAYTHYQQKDIVDAAEALRRATSAGVETDREAFLRAALALERGDLGEAKQRWQEGFDRGGREFRSLMAMSVLLESQGELDKSLEWLLAAEKSFPGFPENNLSAELKQSELLLALGREDEAMAAQERWLAYNPGRYDVLIAVAQWHLEEERADEAAGWYERANEVDPFRRDLHLAWAESLEAIGDLEGAMREYGVYLVVPAELDIDHLKPPREEGGDPVAIALDGPERAEIHFKRAQLAEALGLEKEIRHHLGEAVLAKPGHKASLEWLGRLPNPKEGAEEIK